MSGMGWLLLLFSEHSRLGKVDLNTSSVKQIYILTE